MLASTLINKFKVPVKSGEDVQTISKDSTLIETKAEYRKEVSSHSFIGKIIALVILSIGLGFIYWGHTFLSSASFQPGELQALLSDIGELIKQIQTGELASKWVKPLILMGMGCFFVLVSLRSFYYLDKKYGSLLRR